MIHAYGKRKKEESREKRNRKKLQKHLVERPCRYEVTLQLEKKIKLELDEIFANGARSKYHNWFQVHLWLPILEVVKKYKNNIQALRYIQIAFKFPRILNPYKSLSYGSL